MERKFKNLLGRKKKNMQKKNITFPLYTTNYY